MTLVYATPTDLASWLTAGGSSVPAPTNAAQLLRSASLQVHAALARDVYAIDVGEMPTDAKILAAVRDATCAQVASWLAADIDPLAGTSGAAGKVSSSSILGASVTYTTTASADVASAASWLSSEALLILQGAGLASSAVWAY